MYLGSVLGPLFFLIYIHDLSKNLSSNTELFADDTSIFSTVKNNNLSTDQLNSDLEKIFNWAHQWKMSFNPDPQKQAQEVIFSRKRVKDCHESVFFNDSQKHLGIHLDEKLDFNVHIREKISKACRGIGTIKKLQSKPPRNALLTIYKSCIRHHLDYGDIVFDQPTNDSFCKKLESAQYNAVLAITRAIKGTSQVKLYKELGLESLKLIRKLRRICTFYKIKTTGLPYYLFSLIPNTVHSYQTRTMDNVTKYQCRTEAFQSSFFPWTITEWNSLDLQIRNLSYTAFRKHFIDESRPMPNSVFNIHNPVGIKLLTTLRLGLSHLK